MVTMARTLSEHDIALLLKLAPECDTLICKGSENAYRSILPPVANHYAKDADDFAMRLNRLTDEEFKEGISCIPEECVGVLIEQTLRRVGQEAGNELYALYEAGAQCL